LSDLEVGVSRAPAMKNKGMKNARFSKGRLRGLRRSIEMINRIDRNKLLPAEVYLDYKD
jgi:hypothetical protein